MRFRRAPLTHWCAEFLEAGFLIERLVEPLPAESMKERFPDTYDRFTSEPFFIAFVLVKAPAGCAPLHNCSIHRREAVCGFEGAPLTA